MWIKRIWYCDLYICRNVLYCGVIYLGNNIGKENNYRIIIVFMLFILIGSDNMEVFYIIIYDV